MEQKLITKTLEINGMTCVSCENRIENKLNKLKGVISVNASYSHSMAKITFDGNIIKLSTIMRAIEKLDYEVKRAGQKKKDIKIEKK